MLYGFTPKVSWSDLSQGSSAVEAPRCRALSGIRPKRVELSDTAGSRNFLILITTEPEREFSLLLSLRRIIAPDKLLPLATSLGSPLFL